MVLVMGVFAFPIFLMEQARHRPAKFGEIVIWVLSGAYVLITILVIIASADIVVDDFCISRRFLGWVLQSIRWDNVRLISVRTYYRADEKRVARTIYLYPSTKPRLRFSPSGKMFFGDKIVRLDELIAIINFFASKHRIQIESTTNGVSTSVTSL
jgi:hypothetical protein